MIEPHTRLSVVRQCELVAVSRASVYYRGRACPHDELELMRRMDAQYLRTPFYGSRSLTTYLRRLGYHPINRIRVRRLMRVMGLRSIAPTPNTSQPHPAHKVYPYLLRDLDIKRANQVGAADITYVPMARGFMYLAAIIDWYRRRVLAWRVSNSLDSHFCSEALQAAIDRYGVPEICNTDQGQFTSAAFTACLKNHGIRISMDGKGCYRDNIFVERLWRSVQYECLYIRAFENGKALQQELKRYFDWYNHERPHQGLNDQTPDEVYQGLPHWKQAA